MSGIKLKNILIFSILGIFILTILVLVSVFGPTEIVAAIGVKNGYLLIALVSFFGGYSAAGSTAFIAILIALSAGGLNPLYLSLISGVNLVIGDMILFYFGLQGRELVSEKWDKKINTFADSLRERKWFKKLTPLASYVYIGFLPLPNDVLLLFLAAIEFPVKTMFWIILLGDLTFVFVLTYFVSGVF